MTSDYRFLSTLALAAYHLDTRENDKDLRNNGDKPGAEHAYLEVASNLYLLDNLDVPGLNTNETVFGVNGLENGIYTKKNAAALVGRNGDALYIAFRGTNDNEGHASQPPLGYPYSPDEQNWLGKDDHYKLFRDLFRGLSDYSKDNGITEIQVTGHSLGAAMVDAFVSDLTNAVRFSGIDIEAVNFASPGYGAFRVPFTDLTSFVISKDPILVGSTFGDNVGDVNKIFHNVPASFLGDPALHNMKLYDAFIGFFDESGYTAEDFRLLHNIDYDRIYAHINNFSGGFSESGDFEIGAGRNTIEGSTKNDILLGGAGRDVLRGGEGRDHLDGGQDGSADRLFGNAGGDYLYGGNGNDFLDGGSQSDVMKGQAGGDTLYGRGGSDKMWGGDGVDYLLGGFDSDTLRGGDGDDGLAGEGFHDTLYGGDGNDNLWGGVGRDTLYGGADADNFLFRDDGSTDIIMDFQKNRDWLIVEDFIDGGSISYRRGETILNLYDGERYEYRVKLNGEFTFEDVAYRIIPQDIDSILSEYTGLLSG